MTTLRCFARKVVTAAPTTPLAQVACLMEEHNVGAVVITEQQKPVGIVTDRDLALALGARGHSPQTPVARVMSTPVKTLPQDAGVFYYAARTLMEEEVRRMPIVDDDGWLVGIITLDDLLRVTVRELSYLIEGIKPEMEVRGIPAVGHME
jgi:CBS domain-containing protein